VCGSARPLGSDIFADWGLNVERLSGLRAMMIS
jgi:hypothetical protein